jgi:hypothetical protein
MTFTTIWNGREITGHDPELQEHSNEILQREFIPYAMADPERARRILRKILIDKNGQPYLADLDGNYAGPLPENLRSRYPSASPG